MRAAAALVLAAAVTAGCATHAVTVAPAPPITAQRLGHVRGTGCGIVLFTAVPFELRAFDARMDGRIKRAHADALGQAPGATALTDVTISEHWYWWFLGTTYCTTIAGEAIR